MSRARELTAAALIVPLLLLGACSAERANEPTAGNGQGYVDATNRSLTVVPPDQRRPAPTLSGRVVGGEDSISTADYRDKVVVLNVWGSWCAPCRAEAPDLQQASVATRTKAQFVGLDTKDPAEAAATAFLRAQKISYPSIYDPTGAELVKLSANLPLTAIPSSLIIDKQARVAVRIVGQISKSTLVALIDDVAAGK